MTDWYVSSSQASNSGDGSDWDNAKKYLFLNEGDSSSGLFIDTGVLAVMADGDTVFVDSTHVETHPAYKLVTIPNTDHHDPIKLYSVNNPSGVYETGAQLNNTASYFAINGSYNWYGFGLSNGGQIRLLNSNTSIVRYYGCTFNGSNLQAAAGSSEAFIENCSGYFDSSALAITHSNYGVHATHKNCIYNAPNLGGDSFCDVNFADFGEFLFEDCVFNTNASYMIEQQTSTDRDKHITVRRCKIPSGMAPSPDYPDEEMRNGYILFEHCYAGTDTVPTWQHQIYRAPGKVTAVSTTFRTSGASDGETSWAWEMTYRSSLLPTRILNCFPMTRRVSAGSQTITIYIASDADLYDDEFWVELSSPSEDVPATADTHFQTTKRAVLASGVILTDDTVSSWEGVGAGEEQKISFSINPTETGLVVATCYLHKAGKVVYVDPKLEVS